MLLQIAYQNPQKEQDPQSFLKYLEKTGFNGSISDKKQKYYESSLGTMLEQQEIIQNLGQVTALAMIGLQNEEVNQNL